MTGNLPVILDQPDLGLPETGGGWIVTVYNNETNTYDEVIEILMVATGCGLEEAEMETWEIDHLGQSVVHQADQEECESVAATIRQIGIVVKVSQE